MEVKNSGRNGRLFENSLVIGPFGIYLMRDSSLENAVFLALYGVNLSIVLCQISWVHKKVFADVSQKIKQLSKNNSLNALMTGTPCYKTIDVWRIKSTNTNFLRIIALTYKN